MRAYGRCWVGAPAALPARSRTRWRSCSGVWSRPQPRLPLPRAGHRYIDYRAGEGGRESSAAEVVSPVSPTYSESTSCAAAIRARNLVRVVRNWRKLVESASNFMDGDFRPSPKADVIFCRNVIIYFTIVPPRKGSCKSWPSQLVARGVRIRRALRDPARHGCSPGAAGAGALQESKWSKLTASWRRFICILGSRTSPASRR